MQSAVNNNEAARGTRGSVADNLAIDRADARTKICSTRDARFSSQIASRACASSPFCFPQGELEGLFANKEPFPSTRRRDIEQRTENSRHTLKAS